MRSIILALTIAALAGGVAQAGEPQSAFRTASGKSHVPVTPKVTISSANRHAGLRFNADGSLKTRKLAVGQTTGNTPKTTGK